MDAPHSVYIHVCMFMCLCMYMFKVKYDVVVAAHTLGELASVSLRRFTISTLWRKTKDYLVNAEVVISEMVFLVSLLLEEIPCVLYAC